MATARAIAWSLGLDAEFQSVYDAMTAAELSQAVGRIRAPRRTRPAAVAVVASVAPLSFDARTPVVTLPVGRPRKPAATVPAAGENYLSKKEVDCSFPATPGTMAPSEFARLTARLGSLAAIGAAIGASKSAVARYRTGERAIPPDVAERVRALAPMPAARPVVRVVTVWGYRDETVPTRHARIARHHARPARVGGDPGEEFVTVLL
jgi:hypothetical protein